MLNEKDLANAMRKIDGDPTIETALAGIRGQLSIIFNQVLRDELTRDEIVALVENELNIVYNLFALDYRDAERNDRLA